MFKKVLSLILIVVMSLSLFGCVSKQQKTFKTEAKTLFEQYKSGFGKTDTVFELTDKGYSAFLKLTTKDEALDAELAGFYTATADAFFAKSVKKTDTLIVATRGYRAADNVIGVEVYVKESVAGAVSEKVHTFNTDMPSDLVYMSTVGAKLRLAKRSGVDIAALKKSEGVTYLYKDTCVEVTYPAGSVMSDIEGDVKVEVPYSELYHTLPESLKANTEAPKRAIDPNKKMVAITYDDGPHGVYTPKILDVFEKHNSLATLFEVGNLLQNGAEAVNRAKDMGMEIASHTWSHGNLQTLPLSKIQEQISKADDEFDAVAGIVPTMLRPPYGAVDKELRENTDKHLIGWSVDTLDWQSRDKDKVIAKVKAEGDLDGDVVLMHSLYKSTLEATEYLVPWLINNGYQLVTVTELVAYKYNDLLESGRYYSANYFNGEAKN